MISWVIKGFVYGLKVTSPTAADTDYPLDFVWVNTILNIAYIHGGGGVWWTKNPDYIKNVNVENPIYVIGETSLGEVERGAAYEGGVNSVSGEAPIVVSPGADPKVAIAPATRDAAGSMSAVDKLKADRLHVPDDGEITLTPKASSNSTAEGTIFYADFDNHVYVGVE